MSKKGANNQQELNKLLNIDPAAMPNVAEAACWPWWAGTRMMAGFGLMQATEQFTTPTPVTGGGKGASKGGKGGSAGQSQDFHGSLGLGLGCGPAAFISGLVVDDNLDWPVAPQWPSGVDYVKSKAIARISNVAGIQTATPHGCAVGDLINVSQADDDSFNVTSTAVTLLNGPYGLYYASAGSNVTSVNDDSLYISKVVPVVIGDLRRLGAQIYVATANHNPTPATKPPNPAYWSQYRLNRTDMGVSNPQKSTTETHGDFYLYWGESTQTLDTTNEVIFAANGHPPYRWKTTLMLRRFLFGTERTSAPKVQAILGRKPIQTVITGTAALLDARGCANPFACLAELLTHPVWGVDENLALDATSWQAAADWALANSAWTYISPLVTRAESIRALAGELLMHCDGWVRWNESGEIEAGHWPHDTAAPSFTDATTVNYTDLANGEEMEWDSNLWDDTSNRVTVAYSDAQHAYQTVPAVATNGWNRTATGRIKEVKMDFPHVTDRAQALFLANHLSQLNGDLKFGGTLKLRIDKPDIQPGELFLLTHDAVSLTRVCRCTDKSFTAAPSEQVAITYELERGIAQSAYQPTPADIAGTQLPRPVPVDQFQIIQLPADRDLNAGNPFTVACLASRANEVTTRLDVFLKKADASAYFPLGGQTRFAVAGVVQATYSVYTDGSGGPEIEDDTKHLSVTLATRTDAGDLDTALATQTEDAVNDNALLCVVLKAGSPSIIEICTVREMSASGGNYNLKLRRSRFGTLQGGDGTSDWSVNDLVFILPRDGLIAYSTPSFATFAAAGDAADFRLVPSSAWATGDVGDLYDASTNPTGITLAISFTFADPFAPTITWGTLTKGGSAVNFSTAYVTTDQFVATLLFGSPQGDMTTASIVARNGAGDQVLWSQAIPAGLSYPATTTPFALPTQGTYRLVAVLRTTSGRSTAVTLQDSGSDALLTVQDATPTTTLAPTATPAGFFGNYTSKTVGLACATAGATIQYQIQNNHNAHGGVGSWTTYTGTVTLHRNQTLYAYATHLGLAASPVVSWYFEYDSGL